VIADEFRQAGSALSYLGHVRANAGQFFQQFPERLSVAAGNGMGETLVVMAGFLDDDLLGLGLGPFQETLVCEDDQGNGYEKVGYAMPGLVHDFFTGPAKPFGDAALVVWVARNAKANATVTARGFHTTGQFQRQLNLLVLRFSSGSIVAKQVGGIVEQTQGPFTQYRHNLNLPVKSTVVLMVHDTDGWIANRVWDVPGLQVVVNEPWGNGGLFANMVAVGEFPAGPVSLTETQPFVDNIGIRYCTISLALGSGVLAEALSVASHVSQLAQELTRIGV